MDACDSERRRRGLSLQDVSESSGESCRPRKDCRKRQSFFYLTEYSETKEIRIRSEASADRIDVLFLTADSIFALNSQKLKNSCCLNRGVTL